MLIIIVSIGFDDILSINCLNLFNDVKGLMVLFINFRLKNRELKLNSMWLMLLILECLKKKIKNVFNVKIGIVYLFKFILIINVVIVVLILVFIIILMVCFNVINLVVISLIVIIVVFELFCIKIVIMIFVIIFNIGFDVNLFKIFCSLFFVDVWSLFFMIFKL